MSPIDDPQNFWNFLTNHTHVLLCLADNPKMRMREIASRVLITERAVQRIIAELTDAGYISHEKKGRCNNYQIDMNKKLRHPIEAEKTVAELISLLKKD